MFRVNCKDSRMMSSVPIDFEQVNVWWVCIIFGTEQPHET